MKRFKDYLRENKEELNDIKLFFARCADDIDRDNLLMLRRTCMWTAIVYIGMLFFALAVIPRFRFTIGHLLLVVLLVVFYFINLAHKKENKAIAAFNASFICLLFYFFLGICLILMEINEESVHPARWFPLLLMVFPVLYIDRQYKYGLQETFMILVYAVITFLFKEPIPFFRDMYTVIAAYLMSMIISRVILGVRSKQGLAMLELQRFGSMDKLTSVYNKAALLEAISSYLNHRRAGAPCAMSVIDVDDFKQVNDSLGHEGGDDLLEHIGSLLLDSFRPADIIGRFGGDEFIVFMPNMRDANLIDLRCRTLQMMLADYNIGNNTPFSLSIGTIIDEGEHSMEELFRMADDALYKSKMAGKNQTTSWIAEPEQPMTKPGLIFVTSLGEEKAVLLPKEEGDRFRIFESRSDDEGICQLSQYNENIQLIVAEINDITGVGQLLVKYAKTREKFSKIPVLAVVQNEEGRRIATELGADEVIATGEPWENFKTVIGDMAGKENVKNY